MQSKPDEDVQGQGKGLVNLDICELVSPEASEVGECESSSEGGGDRKRVEEPVA